MQKIKTIPPILNYFYIDDQKNTAAADDADVEAVVMGSNPGYNPGFATLKKMLNNDGRFSCVIPLTHIFGFCRDIRKVIFGASHTVVLQRRSDSNLALWRTGGDDGNVNLTKLAL